MRIFCVYVTCHLTSWFAIYTGLGTFFIFILKRCLQICMFYIDVLFDHKMKSICSRVVWRPCITFAYFCKQK